MSKLKFTLHKVCFLCPAYYLYKQGLKRSIKYWKEHDYKEIRRKRLENVKQQKCSK